MAHIKRILVLYIYEVAKLDIEIANVLNRKPTVNQIGKASDMSEMCMGKIDTDHWTVMFQRGTGAPGAFQKCLFALPEKHLFSTSYIDHILEIINKCSLNDTTAKKNYNDMIQWYIAFRSSLLAVIPKLFNTIKKTQL